MNYINPKDEAKLRAATSQPHVRLLCRCNNLIVITMTQAQMFEAKQNGFNFDCPHCETKLHVRSLAERFGDFFNHNFYLTFKYNLFKRGYLGWTN